MRYGFIPKCLKVQSCSKSSFKRFSRKTVKNVSYSRKIENY